MREMSAPVPGAKRLNPTAREGETPAQQSGSRSMMCDTGVVYQGTNVTIPFQRRRGLRPSFFPSFTMRVSPALRAISTTLFFTMLVLADSGLPPCLQTCLDELPAPPQPTNCGGLLSGLVNSTCICSAMNQGGWSQTLDSCLQKTCSSAELQPARDAAFGDCTTSGSTPTSTGSKQTISTNVHTVTTTNATSTFTGTRSATGNAIFQNTSTTSATNSFLNSQTPPCTSCSQPSSSVAPTHTTPETSLQTPIAPVGNGSNSNGIGNNSGGSSKSNTGAIAGGVIAGLAALVLLLGFCLLKRRRRHANPGQQQSDGPRIHNGAVVVENVPVRSRSTVFGLRSRFSTISTPSIPSTAPPPYVQDELDPPPHFRLSNRASSSTLLNNGVAGEGDDPLSVFANNRAVIPPYEDPDILSKEAW